MSHDQNILISNYKSALFAYLCKYLSAFEWLKFSDSKWGLGMMGNTTLGSRILPLEFDICTHFCCVYIVQRVHK